jgi:putative peptidoglycan lipid II flippase
LVWNIVIIGTLVGLSQVFTGEDQIFAYAIGIILGTIVQVGMAVPVLKKVGFKLGFSLKFRRNPRIKQVCMLMLPVSIGLGIINIDLALNQIFGAMISVEAPAAIDRAFRLYMLPQGVFSVAVSTVIFPALARLATNRDIDGLRATTGNGLRLIGLVLIPSAIFLLVLAEPITVLCYQRGKFSAESTELVTSALIWFSLSLPFAGANLLLTKAFFSIQRPWLPTIIALATVVINAVVSLALYKPLGIPGPVIATLASNIALTIGQVYYLRKDFNGLEIGRTLKASALMLLASAIAAAAAYPTWMGLDSLLGHSTWVQQSVSLLTALGLAGAIYFLLITLFKIDEAHQTLAVLRGRFGRGPRSSTS